jgi:hypothetical protein
MVKTKAGRTGQVIELKNLQEQLTVIRNHVDNFEKMIENHYEYYGSPQIEEAVSQLAKECLEYLVMLANILPRQAIVSCYEDDLL